AGLPVATHSWSPTRSIRSAGSGRAGDPSHDAIVARHVGQDDLVIPGLPGVGRAPLHPPTERSNPGEPLARCLPARGPMARALADARPHAARSPDGPGG